MNFLPIMKRELNAYFYSPIAYVITTIFLIINGYFFFGMMVRFSEYSRVVTMQNPNAIININDGVVRQLFGNMSFIMLLMLPILTMRLFSEEKKSGTFELITTYPLKDIEVVLGKIFSCVVVLLTMLVLTLVYPFLIAKYSTPDMGIILSGYLGVILTGIAFISLGAFISSLTENQIVSAVITFGILLLFWMLGWMASFSFAEGLLSQIFTQLSLITHFDNFSKGVIDLSDIVYYLNFICLSIFLTLRSLESKKWRS